MASKEKYWESSVDKQMLISVVGTNVAIDNSMLESGTFSLEESLCSESELKFGCCEANSVKFTAHNTAGSLVGKTISISETLDGDTENPTQYGVYKVYSDIPTADRTKRQITAYDAMYDIINADVKAWYAGLSFPMTLKAFRDSFFSYLGIEQEDVTLVNDGITVNKTLVATQTDDSSAVTEESSISGKTVVTAICEINGCFGNINRDGKFEYVILPNIISAVYPADDLYPADNLFPSDANRLSMSGYYITFDYEDFKSKAITQLEIRPNDSSAGEIVGTSGNNYVISGNFLVSDKTSAELEQIANNVFPIMKQAAYTPLKTCTCVGNPCMELGDAIRFNTSKEVVETYILQRTLTGVQSKRDSIVAQGTETHSAKVNSIRETLSTIKERTNVLERTADQTVSEIKSLNEITETGFKDLSTKISQTARTIGLEVNGGEQSVGIKISLYDEDENLINSSEGEANIEITGFVSFLDLLSEGKTIINGANITTGDISADRIRGGTLSGDTKIQLGKLPDGVSGLAGYNYAVVIDDNAWYPIDQHNPSGKMFAADCTSDINGVLFFQTDNEYDSGFKRKRIELGSTLVDYANGYLAGMTDVYSDRIEVTSFPVNGASGSTAYTKIYGGHVDTSSDRRLKGDIKPLGEKFNSFINRLCEMAVSYYFNGQEFDGHRIGFIAQDIETAMLECGLTQDDVSIVKKYPQKDNLGNVVDYTYSLTYTDFIGLLFRKNQMQDTEIEQLKQDNFAMQGELAILKQELEDLKNVINNKIN